MLLIYIIWKEGDKSNLFVRCFQNANFSNTWVCACHLTDCGKWEFLELKNLRGRSFFAFFLSYITLKLESYAFFFCFSGLFVL